MLAVLELAVAVLPVLELATMVASIATMPDTIASHVPSSHHVPASHVSTVTTVRELVSTVSGGSSGCTSS